MVHLKGAGCLPKAIKVTNQMIPQKKLRQLTLHMTQEKTHRISAEMYSFEGVMAYPRSSRAFSILKVERIDAMLKYTDDTAMCIAGQILKTIRTHH
jgi:hypothetical protein